MSNVNPILSMALGGETDVVAVRQRTRVVAALVGFDRQDQARFTAAVSEIARNAWEYAGGGRVEFRIAGTMSAQALEIVVTDSGCGIADLDRILAGAARSPGGSGLGIIGARRLMDHFEIVTSAERGTIVTMAKPLLRRRAALTPRDIAALAREVAAAGSANPAEEVRQQNRELLAQLDELQAREQELMHLNQELQDTNRGVVALYAELDERADHLRRADELKSRFLSNMSHEFRTPLNSILSLTRLLLSRDDGPLTIEQERQVQFVRKSAETLYELVNDLLDLAKVEAGKTVVTAREFTVNDLFGALRGMLRPLLVGDAVALVFEEPADIPALVTDEAKVSQILRNFISNALKFTERGEVRIASRFDAITDQVTFSVCDTGIGIAEDAVAAIWQEFSQIDHPLQQRVKGTGLGLPLSKKLAELLGGRVGVESRPGHGSRFTVTLPRAVAAPEIEPRVVADWAADPDRVSVLVVEDDAADAFMVERALARSRYQVLAVEGTRDAERALARIAPAAVLLDIVLRGEEAWQFLVRTKQQPMTENMPVVVISSATEEGKARDLGADAYLAKPIDPQVLVATLDAVTGKHTVTRVLIVDGEELFRYLVRQLLPRRAFAVEEAANGRDGLARARAEPYDAILFDIAMPDMDGVAFLEALRDSAMASDVAAIVLTARTLDPRQHERLESECEILSKANLCRDDLIAALRRAIGPRTVEAVP